MKIKQDRDQGELSPGYVASLLKRNSHIALKPCLMVDAITTVGNNHQELSTFFETLAKYTVENKYDKRLVFNYDETMIDYSKRKVRVIVPQGEKVGLKAALGVSFHLTLGLFVSADVEHLKPLLICPLKEIPVDALQQLDDFLWSGQANGWIITEIFCSLIKIVVDEVNKKRTRNNLKERGLL